MGKQQLHALLCELFSVSELRRLVEHDDALRAIAPDLPEGDVSIAKFVDEFLLIIGRRGLLNAALFEKIIELRPLKATQIERVRDLFEQVERSPAAAASGRWFSFRLRLGKLKVFIMLVFAGLCFGVAAIVSEQDSEYRSDMGSARVAHDPSEDSAMESVAEPMTDMPEVGLPEPEEVHVYPTPSAKYPVSPAKSEARVKASFRRIVRSRALRDCFQRHLGPVRIVVTVTAGTGKVTVKFPTIPDGSGSTECVRRRVEGLRLPFEEPGNEDLTFTYEIDGD